MDDPRYPVTLRFRPEFEGDLDALKKMLEPAQREGLLEVEHGIIEFTPRSPGDLAEVILAMNRGMDLHRMVQTMDLSEHFGSWPDGETERAGRILALLEKARPEARRAYLQYVDLGPEGAAEPA